MQSHQNTVVHALQAKRFAYSLFLAISLSVSTTACSQQSSEQMNRLAPTSVKPVSPAYDPKLAHVETKYSQDEIRQALLSGGAYIGNVVLDDLGRSQGDYDWVTGKWRQYEPAWHTGQAIFGLTEAYRVTGEQSLIDNAKRAADWWISLTYTDHPVLKGFLRAEHGDRVGDYINFTTISDGSNGVFELARELNRLDYAQVATDAGNWAIDNLYIKEEGLIYNIVDPETGEIWKDKSPHGQHNEDGKITLHEVARPNNEGYLFRDMYEFTGDERHLEVHLALCDSLVEKQDEFGLWLDYEPNNPALNRLHPRFNIWYAESLLRCEDYVQGKGYMEAAMRTMQFMAKLQEINRLGELYYFQFTDVSNLEDSITGSAVSFAALQWMELKARTGTSEFDDNIKAAVQFVMENRFPEDHADENLRGGFLETRRKRRDGRFQIAVRGIATSFGLRFLSQYYRSFPEQANLQS
uniref:hypothetical protein n=1 Tax=Ningiella ruwaisensis TaxID=2364274 RepID=UPI00109FF5D2|nr:hypothetical protein [Ningiella ruwaisensis]